MPLVLLFIKTPAFGGVFMKTINTELKNPEQSEKFPDDMKPLMKNDINFTTLIT